MKHCRKLTQLFVYQVALFWKQLTKQCLPSTSLEQPAGSQELAQEAVNLMKLNQSVRCFVLKNYGVVALGATMSDAGKQIEAIQA